MSEPNTGLANSVARLVRRHNLLLLATFCAGLAAVAVRTSSSGWRHSAQFVAWSSTLRWLCPILAALAAIAALAATAAYTQRQVSRIALSAEREAALLGAFARSKAFSIAALALAFAGGLPGVVLCGRTLDVLLAAGLFALLIVARPAESGFDTFVRLATNPD